MYIKRDCKKLGIKGCVYKLFFLGSDNFYIGSTNDLTQRMYFHFNRLRKLKGDHGNPCLENASRKYGIDNLRFTILHIFNEYASNLEIREVEQWYLDELNPEYNISKIATGGMGTSLSKEDILDIRKRFASFVTKQDFSEYCRSKFDLTTEYLLKVARGHDLSNVLEGSEYFDRNKEHRFKISYGNFGGPPNLVNPARNLTDEQAGIFLWAIDNNKSTSQLANIFGLKNDPSYRLKQGIICQEITEMIDGSYLNLNDKLENRSSELTVYVYDLEGFYLFEGDLNEVSEKIGLKSKYLISDTLKGKYTSLKGYRFSEIKLGKLPYKRVNNQDIWGQFEGKELLCFGLGSKGLAEKLGTTNRTVANRLGKVKTRGSQSGKMFRTLTKQELEQINK